MQMKRRGPTVSLIALGVGLAGISFPSAATAAGNVPKIAFVRVIGQDGHIFTMNTDGTKPTDLSKAEGDTPAWSPDGTKITFVSSRATGADPQIYMMSANGTHQTRLTHDSMPDTHPTWSPDGTKLVFEGNGGLFVLTLKTKAVRQLTQGPDSAPAWSPDGTRIVFERDRTVPNPTSTTGTDTEQDLWVMAADGTQARQLTSPPPFSVGSTNFAGTDSLPAWSPDGAKIAFESNRASNNGIFVMNADGTNIAALTQPAGNDEHPAWSPDGARIAFDRTGEPVLSSKSQIYVMNADGSNQAALTTTSAGASSPAWQPQRQRTAPGH
jgi:Tol biopolymer transport system component